MRRNWLGYLVVSIALVAGVAYYTNRPTGKLPESVFDKMEFPPDAVMEDMDGDENGTMCQPLYIKTADGTVMVAWHKLWKHDFRKMTVGQKKTALIQGAKDAAREVDLLACSDPGGVFLHQAYAQPHCESCGGGCGTIGCPATIQPGGLCTHHGPNCVIVVVCCGVPCVCP